MKRRIVCLVGCILFVCALGEASTLSFKIYGGLSWVNGGDLNSSIRGWRQYCVDHNVSPYSFDYRLDEFRNIREYGIEFVFHSSPWLSIGVGFGFFSRKISGEVSWDYSHQKTYVNSPNDFGEITTTEESLQEPRYALQAFPVVVSLSLSLPLGGRHVFSLSAGGGVYFGLMHYGEDYSYSFDYVDERTINGAVFPDVDQYYVSGEFRESLSSVGFGFHAGGSLELKISSSLSFLVEVLTRWVNFKSWKGTRADSYDWEHTWGLFGNEYDLGTEEETGRGTLWFVDIRSDETGELYPRLIFSDQMPVSSSYRSVREGAININGISLRVGFLIKV